MDETITYHGLEGLVLDADYAASLVRLAHSDIFNEPGLPSDPDGVVRCTDEQAEALAFAINILEDAMRKSRKGWYLAHENAAKAQRD